MMRWPDRCVSNTIKSTSELEKYNKKRDKVCSTNSFQETHLILGLSFHYVAISIANYLLDTYICSRCPRGTAFTISRMSTDRINTLEHVYSAVEEKALVLLEIIARLQHGAGMTGADHDNMNLRRCWIKA